MPRPQPNQPPTNSSPPNPIPNPTSAKASTPAIQSIMFFIMMFDTFFDLVSPASTRANPACMKNTRTPAMNTHRLSRMNWVAKPGSSWAIAGLATTSTSRALSAPPINSFLFALFTMCLLRGPR